MLNKNQLEFMTRCGKIWGCRGCEAMCDFNEPRPSACVEKAAQTALAYRALLEEAANEIEYCYFLNSIREIDLPKRIREAISRQDRYMQK